jgi:hypothetical protein
MVLLPLAINEAVPVEPSCDIRPAPTPPRDYRLDFVRGLALILIFIDHIPDNILSYFTLRSVQFFDAAEVFIFISGYTAALVYGRTLAHQGALYATAQILRRAWQLYVAHIFLFMIFIAEVSYTVMTFNNPMYNEEMRVGEFLSEPHVAVVKALLLQFQPTFLDILPLYIVLLAAFPAVLVALRLWPLMVLIPSLLLYVFVQATDMSVAAYPLGHVWYFNPLAWQFLFFTGAALGLGGGLWRQFARCRRPLFLGSVLVVAVASLVRLSWTIHGIWDPFPGLFFDSLWPVNKSNLSPLRLIPFFAAALIVVVLVPPGARFLRAAAAKPLVLCGRHSLEIFCLGILLSVLGHFLLSEYELGMIAQLMVDIVGITVMCLTASLIDWYRYMGHGRSPASVTAAREE